MRTTVRALCVLFAVTAIAGADDRTNQGNTQASKGTANTQAKKKMPASRSDMTGGATFANIADMKWMAAPPELPKGAQISVLYGDPTKPDTFTMRMKAPSGYVIPPHWHTQDEHLSVISGTLVFHMGDSMKSEPHALQAGGYHFLPGGLHHSAQARGETVVQITGHGPFDIHYVNPADNPNPRSASR